MTVPGDPGDIGHQGLAGAGEAVEEGGLPHVGPADDGHQGLLGRNRSHDWGARCWARFLGGQLRSISTAFFN